MPFRAVARLVVIVSGCCAAAVGLAAETGEAVLLRVESEIFVGDQEEPVARSLTLFDGDTTWDFLDPPGGQESRAVASVAGCDQIILHDPVRERVIVLDPRRRLKTQVDVLRLERLSASLGKWARSSDDKLIRWAGGADVGAAIAEQDGSIELEGPRVKYAVHYSAAPSRELATAYRTFADTAILLKALLHPGGLPPFPRLAINRRIESAGGIPSEVRLEVGASLSRLGRPAETLRSVHRTMPRLTDADQTRIDDAAALVAVAEEVDLAEFVSRTVPEKETTPGS